MSQDALRSTELDGPLRAATQFRRVHGHAPTGVWSAPGRVNFIGEHTDYNDGFVLPFALPHRIAVAASARTDGTLRATTIGDDLRPQRAPVVDIAKVAPGELRGWSAYPAGVAWALREHGGELVGRADLSGGADLVITGDVPAGAGLSSSAALECAVALTLLGLAGVDPDAAPTNRSAIARLCQQAENDFVGAPTGILDQTASLRCAEDSLLFLDVRSGASEQVRFAPAEDNLAVLVIDTRANHLHSESGYGDRRKGCERAAEILGVAALRDVTPETLAHSLARLPEELRPLVRHVVTENDRVLSVVAALRAGTIDAVGPELTSSHRSLRDDYRVSCPELDLAVDTALEHGALGARMTGGGFGGSAIALVRAENVEGLSVAMADAFADAAFTTPRQFVSVPSAGARRDENVEKSMR